MANIFKVFKKIKDFDDFLEMTKLDGILNKNKREQEEAEAAKRRNIIITILDPCFKKKIIPRNNIFL